MAKISKKINFPAELWVYIQSEAKSNHKSMNQYLTDLVVSDMHGITQPVARVTSNGPKKEKQKAFRDMDEDEKREWVKAESLKRFPEPIDMSPEASIERASGVPIKRIQALQREIEDVEALLEEVVGGMQGEELEEVKRTNDYVRENFETLENLRTELKTLVPSFKEEENV